mgnify:CR=1 FL=1
MNKIKIEMFQNAYSNFYSLCYHYCDVYKMDKKIEIKKLYIILKICTHFGIQFTFGKITQIFNKRFIF